MTSETPSSPPEPDNVAQLLAAADEAEAEAVAAEAESRAAAARARAIRMRRQAATTRAEATRDEPAAEDDAAEDDAAVDFPGDPVDQETPVAVADRPVRRRRRPGAMALAVSAAILLICALAGASGYLLWQHHIAVQRQEAAAEFSAAARQGVVNLMTVDFNNAEKDVQRLLDSSTGKFRDDLKATSGELVDSLAQSKVVTKVTVQSSAVESMSADTGVVLVAARSEAGSTTGSPRPPADWHLAVTLSRDGGQLKMSQVDFVTK
jgi:Mce-associated membrane protein